MLPHYFFTNADWLDEFYVKYIQPPSSIGGTRRIQEWTTSHKET